MSHLQRKYPREYSSWANLRQRCNNPKRPDWKHYGGRGIKCCARWSRFQNFLADMGGRPNGTMIGRIDNNGDYTPENCRWETYGQQSRNKRNCVDSCRICGRKRSYFSHGRCRKCAWYYRKHKIERPKVRKVKPARRRSNEKCSACRKRVAIRRSLCHRCYEFWRRTGRQRPKHRHLLYPAKEHTEVCSVCGDLWYPGFTKGMCNRCYQRSRYKKKRKC